MQLYVRTGCPFCARVLAVLREQDIPYEEKNIGDNSIAEELILRGGKRQVPFLVDGEVSLYESEDIVEYLKDRYRRTASEDVSASTGKGGVCPVE